MTAEQAAPDAIRAEGIAKHFGTVTALRDINIRVARGEELGLIGDNGTNIPSGNAEVATLWGGKRQGIAVAGSVYSNAKTPLVDEPLAAMGAKEGGIILDLVKMLRDRGDLSVIIIAHNYSQVFDV